LRTVVTLQFLPSLPGSCPRRGGGVRRGVLQDRPPGGRHDGPPAAARPRDGLAPRPIRRSPVVVLGVIVVNRGFRLTSFKSIFSPRWKFTLDAPFHLFGLCGFKLPLDCCSLLTVARGQGSYVINIFLLDKGAKFAQLSFRWRLGFILIGCAVAVASAVFFEFRREVALV